MATRLLLIRHARVDTGTPPRLCGSLDLPLSARGRQAMETLRVTCRGTSAPDALYTSPLIRARETAGVLANVWQRDMRVDDDLGEIHCGQLEGARIEEIARDHPSLWARNLAQNDDDFTWPGGESYRQFRQRALGALRRISAGHEAQRVAVVTHAGVVAQVLGALRGRPAAVWELDRPEPLTVTEVIFVDGAPHAVLTFNRRDWC